MDNAQLHILRHALGIRDDGRGATYRNHFVTGEDSAAHPHCMELVDSGHMERHASNELTGGDDLFTATESGLQAARPQHPERMTRGQRRYRAYLDADSGLHFGEWLIRGGAARG